MSVPFGVALTCSDAFLSLKPQYIQEDPKGDRGLLRQSPSLHPVERPQRREVDRLPTWHGVAHSHPISLHGSLAHVTFPQGIPG